MIGVLYFIVPFIVIAYGLYALLDPRPDEGWENEETPLMSEPVSLRRFEASGEVRYEVIFRPTAMVNGHEYRVTVPGKGQPDRVWIYCRKGNLVDVSEAVTG